MEMTSPSVVPEEIGRANEWDVKILWKDGHESIYSARDLRLKCPCANCKEEMTGRELVKPELIPEDVHPNALNLVGRYAIRIDWSDGHNTGIYTFEYLRAMG